jgi:hypothetical protein
MASNRGPGAVAPSGGASNDAYYKSREQQGNNAFSWAKEGGHHSSGGVGGSWAATPPSKPSYAEQHSSTPSITVNSAPGSSSINHGSGGTAVSDGSYEKNLIMELCPPGGMKPVPPPEKLLNFAKSVPSLNADLICPVLLDCLEEGHPWIMRAKALCVMETCIQSGRKEDNSNPYANFFYTCREEIEPLASHPRAAIKDPARRVLALLGITTAASSTPAAPSPAAAPAAPVPNLLDFDDDDTSPPAAAPPANPPPPPPTAPPAPPASSSQGSSLFGELQVKSPAGGAPAAAAPVAPAPTSGNLLDGLEINDKSSKPAEVTNMFDSMTIKSKESAEEEKKKQPEDDLAAVGTSGSAFGFINDEASKQAPAGEAAATAAPPNKAAFDPLLNFSPNTARQMMQVSPEQMQAMAYQQMLMQQQHQQQMLQMQMAMAMQGGRPGGIPMQMMSPGMPQKAGVMGPHPGMNTSSGFSFLDNPAKKKDDHTFDFVMDAMKTEKTQK